MFTRSGKSANTCAARGLPELTTANTARNCVSQVTLNASVLTLGPGEGEDNSSDAFRGLCRLPSPVSEQPGGRLRRRDAGAPRASAWRCPTAQIVALLGANGAGKTTLLRALTGLLDVHDGEITKGSVTLDGEPHPRPARRQDRAPRRQPGDGGPADLRRADRRGEPAGRRAHQRRRDRATNLRAGLRPVPAAGASGASRPPATCPAASSRCSRWAGR